VGWLEHCLHRLYAGAVRLRIALIVLALVVVPAIVFAVAKNHPASHPFVGWTAYVAHAPTGGAANTKAEKTAQTDATKWETAAIQSDVAKWETNHPGGSCTISYPDSAYCTTADGLPADLVVMDSVTVSPTGAP
jgi:hypothetical protein